MTFEEPPEDFINDRGESMLKHHNEEDEDEILGTPPEH
jgi:hypothetical protein